MRTMNEILADYTSGKATPEETNAALKEIDCPLTIIPGKNELTEADIRTERIMLGLRTREGIEEELLAGRDFGRVERFLKREGGRVSLTDEGIAVMNSVLAEII